MDSGLQTGRPAGVVLTSSRQPGDLAARLLLGAHDYRIKPTSMAELCAVVREIEGYWMDLQRESRRLALREQVEDQRQDSR
jgi:DNA-binding response OmpR family regulator